MRDLFLLATFLSFLAIGIDTPFVLACGYIWVDLMSPQSIGYGFMRSIPVAMIMGGMAIMVWVVKDRRDPPLRSPGVWLTIAFAVWVTLTTTWAVNPDMAWEKWNWAVKTVLFAAFLPFVIRTRVQIEAMILVIMATLAANIIPYGIKGILTGGGYGMELGLIQSNTGLGESSAVAIISASMIPVTLYLMGNSMLLPKIGLIRLGLIGYIPIQVMAVIATVARAGLISLGVLALFQFWKSKRKLSYLLGLAVVGGFAANMVGESWIERMNTIKAPGTESSAATRIAVWEWTLDYVKSHPMGGGFHMYVINSFTIVGENGEVSEGHSRAFHNSYIEVIGEHGYPGIAIFMSVLIGSLLRFRFVERKARKMPGMEWAANLARALFVAQLSYMAGAVFIGVAFQPFFWYFAALSISLSALIARELKAPTAQAVAQPGSPARRFGARPPASVLPPAAALSPP